MKSIRAFSPLALVFLLFGSSLPSQSPEQQPEGDVRSWMIVLPKSMDADPEVYQIGPLEEGESRQFFTSDGDEINVERDGSGRTIELNGNEIQTHRHRGAYNITTHIGDEHKAIHLHKEDVVSSSENEEEAELHSEHHGEGDSEHHMFLSVMKHDSHPAIQVNTLSTGGDSPQIIVIDRLHIEKEEN